ncbi:MAG: hypothetical protein Q9216_001375 [Gyalolechia sp. 2 TL-2023]
MLVKRLECTRSIGGQQDVTEDARMTSSFSQTVSTKLIGIEDDENLQVFTTITSVPGPFFKLLARNLNRRTVRHILSKRFESTKPPFNPTPNLGSPKPSLSLSQRLRKLSREYGWSALGVYLLLTALDFPLCFLAVRWIGTETIGRWESVIVDQFWRLLDLLPSSSRSGPQPVEVVESVQTEAEESEVAEGYDHGVKEAEERNKSEDASLWTQLALAYAIHKSFIFIRVPLTAAITPNVVKVLRRWGWDIGKRRPKAVQSGGKE